MAGIFLLSSIPAYSRGAEPADPAVSLEAVVSVAPEKPIRLQYEGDRQLLETYDRAEELLSAGRVEEAAEQFGVVAKLAEEPLKSRAMLKFGFAASILERPEARQALTHALQTRVAEPEGGEIRSFARDILESSGQSPILTAPPKDASKFFSMRHVAAPESVWDKISDIEILRRKGRLTTAIGMYRDLLASCPDHPVILNNMALLLAEGVDVDEAEQLVRRAFQSPGAENYVEYLYDTLGYVLLKRGQAVESVENFRRALSMRETPERNWHMAMALDSLGQPDAAEQYRGRAGALDTTGRLDGLK